MRAAMHSTHLPSRACKHAVASSLRWFSRRKLSSTPVFPTFQAPAAVPPPQLCKHYARHLFGHTCAVTRKRVRMCIWINFNGIIIINRMFLDDKKNKVRSLVYEQNYKLSQKKKGHSHYETTFTYIHYIWWYIPRKINMHQNFTIRLPHQ